MEGERRAAVTADTVKKIVNHGGVVLIEKGAGTGAYISDEDYEKAGAVIIPETEQVYARTDIILKVKEPNLCRYGDRTVAALIHRNVTGSVLTVRKIFRPVFL